MKQYYLPGLSANVAEVDIEGSEVGYVIEENGDYRWFGWIRQNGKLLMKSDIGIIGDDIIFLRNFSSIMKPETEFNRVWDAYQYMLILPRWDKTPYFVKDTARGEIPGFCDSGYSMTAAEEREILPDYWKNRWAYRKR